MPVEKLYTLRQLRDATGVPIATLRAEVRDGRLLAVRARPGCSAPLLVAETAWERWIEDCASQRCAGRFDGPTLRTASAQIADGLL